MSTTPPINQQINVCATLLGRAILHTNGNDTLKLVETLRKKAARIRGATEKKAKKKLLSLLNTIEGLPPQKTLLVAKAFSIYLVLINACENAYRTSRLKASFRGEASPLKGSLIYVLTAHPTEIRSTQSISLIRRITGVLVDWFSRGPNSDPLTEEERQLYALISLVWQRGIHKTSAVTPVEEIDHIAGQFSDQILSEIFKLRRRGANLKFRTWVGGDKDGHPGISASTLHTSFRRSRYQLYNFFKKRLFHIKGDLQFLGDQIKHTVKQIERALMDVKHITSGDGIRLNTLRYTVRQLSSQVRSLLGGLPHALEEIVDLMDLFPGMVLPVELREESTIFKNLDKKNAIGTIGRMLRKADKIAEGGHLLHYVQGLIVSMTKTPQDLEAAINVSKRAIGMGKTPIIPLFERGEDLEEAPDTINTILSNHLPVLANEAENGTKEKKLEIMLGYSDTAKRMGAFASRRQIYRSMHKLTLVCQKHGIKPIFFHGAGGSITRGGGSIEEQFAAWPRGALETIKFTLQGEMVERTLATAEIFRRNVERLLTTSESLTPRPITTKHTIQDELAKSSANAFEKLIKNKDFQRFVALATPYQDLMVLHLGSRPSHRPNKSQGSNLKSLRAIPWVLCFTQGRFLIPSWYGIGTAFQLLSKTPEKLSALQNAYKNDMAFRGFVKLMGFSIAKGDRAVFSLFADTLANEPKLKILQKVLLDEEERVSQMIQTLSLQNNHLWFRPWLAKSILLRGSTIHPLSVIEVMALRSRRQNIQQLYNDELLRIAIAGVAVGMLTTG
jgi:phosphoenolpyruvate carboxylase